MRWSRGFHNRIARCRLTLGLQFLLQHGLVVGFGGGDRVNLLEFFDQPAPDKGGRRAESTVQKNRARYCLKDIGQQRVFATAAALFFTPTKTQEVAEVETQGSL